MEKADFAGASGEYVVATWDENALRWRFRPVMGGTLLTDAEIAALGLDAPLTDLPGKLPPVAYSQRNPLWAGVKLGRSAYTMGNAGCAVTACTMAASIVQPEITPLTLVTWLNANNGFTSGGLLYWAKVAEFVPGMTWVDYHVWRDVSADMAALKTALLSGPQIVQVDFRPGGGLDSHFVTAIALTPDGKDLDVIDPWTGERGLLLTMYGGAGWSLSRAVYALAEFAYA